MLCGAMVMAEGTIKVFLEEMAFEQVCERQVCSAIYQQSNVSELPFTCL